MSSSKTVTGLSVSIVLDRRGFLAAAGLTAGAVTLAAAWSAGSQALLGQGAAAGSLLTAPPAAEPPMDWAVDHIFGTYPPYAHPIPYAQHGDAVSVVAEPGSFDPILMI
jgi:hypothetical protein